MKTAEETVVLTPIYKGEIYKYHECSNCKKEIYFKEDIFQPFHFDENIKHYVVEVDKSKLEDALKKLFNAQEIIIK